MTKKQVYNRKSELDTNRNLYKIPGGNNYQLRSKDAVYFASNETIKHAMAKALAGIMIKKWGDVKFTQPILTALKVLSEITNDEFREWPKAKGHFITEAVIKKQPDRRVDLVNLETNDLIEFETNKKIKKEGAVTIYLK